MDTFEHFDTGQHYVDSLPDEVLDYILSVRVVELLTSILRRLNTIFHLQLVSSYGDLRNCYQVCHRWRDAVLRVAHNHKISLFRDIPDMKLLW